MNGGINEYNNTLFLPVNNNDMVNKLGGAVLENKFLIQNIVKYGNGNTYGREQNCDFHQIEKKTFR